MSVEAVKSYFREKGMEERVLEFPVSSATVALAAEALHCEPGRIAKTLSFMVEDRPILIVTAGDRKISNSKYKAKFGKKPKCSRQKSLQNSWDMLPEEYAPLP